MGSQSEREADKARDRKNKRAEQTPPVSYEFINVDLSEADKKELAMLVFTGIDAFDFMLQCLHDGFKVSLSDDSKNHTVVASMTDMDANSETRGCILTARGRDALKAVASLRFKHTVLLRDGWKRPKQGRLFDVEYG